MYVASAFRRTVRAVRLKPDTTYYTVVKSAVERLARRCNASLYVSGRTRVSAQADTWVGPYAFRRYTDVQTTLGRPARHPHLFARRGL